MSRPFLALLVGAVHSLAPPSFGQTGDKANVVAGPEPPIDEAKELMLRRLYDRLRDPDSVKQFRWLGQPKIVTWYTQMPRGLSKEEGWLYCYQYNATTGYGGYAGVQVQMEVLRVFNGRVVAIPPSIWTGGVSSSACE